jgi:hypothetical protein
MLCARGNLQPPDLIGSLASAFNPYCGHGAEDVQPAGDSGSRLALARDA